MRKECPMCDGAGMVADPLQPEKTILFECSLCGGSGKVSKCRLLPGRGYVFCQHGPEFDINVIQAYLAQAGTAIQYCPYCGEEVEYDR